jgi:outer membrane receptor protein involved in Fe transport
MQTFSNVAPGRATETLTSTQFVNTTTTRGIFEAGHTIPRGYVTGRVMVSRAPADFTEERPSSATTMDLHDDGESVSVHAGWSPVLPVTIGAGIRGEWRAAPASGDRDSATVGYVSGAWQASQMVVVRGSAATSHRWPTLNELVRNFQVGSVLTQANPDLLPERARSVDAAVAVTGARWSASAAGFFTIVEDAVTNVTIQSTPTIIRQRRNAANAEALGLELDAEARLWRIATIRASAVFVDSRFRDSVEPALEGNQLPQVPPASLSLSGDVRIRPWLQVASVYRYLGPQFDDDRNVFELARASQVDLRVFGDIKTFTWYVTVENAADARIEVGRTPLVTLAPGRAVRVGVTWHR